MRCITVSTHSTGCETISLSYNIKLFFVFFTVEQCNSTCTVIVHTHSPGAIRLHDVNGARALIEGTVCASLYT